MERDSLGRNTPKSRPAKPTRNGQKPTRNAQPVPLQRPEAAQTLSQILSIKQAAAYLNISRTQVLKLLHGGTPGPRPRFARAGNRILIKAIWLEQWLEASARYQERES